MTERPDEIALLDAWLTALERDPNAPIPAGLDPEFARFVRSMVAHQTEINRVQMRVWQRSFQEARALRAYLRPNRPNRSVWLTRTGLLAAGVIFALLILRPVKPPENIVTPAAKPGTTVSTMASTSLGTAQGAALVTPAFVTLDATSHRPLNPPVPITAQNADRLVLAEQPGRGAVRDIAWSPDRTKIAVSSPGGLWLYTLDALDSLGTQLVGYSGDVQHVVFSPDGLTLASTGAEGVILWDIPNARAILRTPHAGASAVIAFSADGHLLAIGEGGSVSLWAAGSQRVQIENFAVPVTSLAFSPDSLSLAIGGPDGAIRLWDVQKHAQSGILQSDSTAITALAFSGNGKILASGSAANWVRVWEMATRTLLHSRADVLNGVQSLDLNTEGTQVAYTDGTSAWLWMDRTSTDPAFLDKATRWRSLVLDRDGTPLAIGLDSTGWRQWGRKWPNPLLRGFTEDHAFTSLGFTGKQIAAGTSAGNTWLWDTNSRLPNGTIATANTGGIALSPDGKWIAAGANEGVQVWDWSHKAYRLLPVPANVSSAIASVAFSPDGTLLASGGGAVILWDTVNWKLKTIVAAESGMEVTFSLDGRLLAYRTTAGVRLWAISTQSVTTTIPAAGSAIVFSSDATLLAFGHDQNIDVWNIAGNKLVLTLHGQANTITALAFSPDGKLIASVSADGTIAVWDSATGTQQAVLHPAGHVYTAAFSPDGTVLATAGDDGTLDFWRVGR
jgi:WD40 repeat protein